MRIHQNQLTHTYQKILSYYLGLLFTKKKKKRKNYSSTCKTNSLNKIFLRLTKDNPKQSKLHYTRGITPERMSGGAHIRSLAPGLQSSEEASQRRRPCTESNPDLPHRQRVRLATELTTGFQDQSVYCKFNFDDLFTLSAYRESYFLPDNTDGFRRTGIKGIKSSLLKFEPNIFIHSNFDTSKRTKMHTAFACIPSIQSPQKAWISRTNLKEHIEDKIILKQAINKFARSFITADLNNSHAAKKQKKKK